MGSNHMNEHFRRIKQEEIEKQTKGNREIPTHDPYTGELNPYYEDLTGQENPLKKNIK